MVRNYSPVLAVGQRTQSTHGFTLLDMSSRPYEPFDLADVESVTLTMEHGYWGETVVEGEPVTIPEETAAEGYVEYQFDQDETRYHGTHYIQFAIEWPGGSSDLVPPDGSDWELHVGRRLPRSSPLRSARAVFDEASIGSLSVDTLSLNGRAETFAVDELDASVITGAVTDGNRLTGFGGGFNWNDGELSVAIDDFGSVEGLTLPMTQSLPLAGYDIEGAGRAGTPDDPLTEVYAEGGRIGTAESPLESLHTEGGRIGSETSRVEQVFSEVVDGDEISANELYQLVYDGQQRPVMQAGPFEVELSNGTIEVGERDWALLSRASAAASVVNVPAVIIRDNGHIDIFGADGARTLSVTRDDVTIDKLLNLAGADIENVGELTAESLVANDFSFGGALNADGERIINLGDPEDPQDAVSQSYVDDLASENIEGASNPATGDYDLNNYDLLNGGRLNGNLTDGAELGYELFDDFGDGDLDNRQQQILGWYLNGGGEARQGTYRPGDWSRSSSVTLPSDGAYLDLDVDGTSVSINRPVSTMVGYWEWDVEITQFDDSLGQLIPLRNTGDGDDLVSLRINDDSNGSVRLRYRDANGDERTVLRHNEESGVYVSPGDRLRIGLSRDHDGTWDLFVGGEHVGSAESDTFADVSIDEVETRVQVGGDIGVHLHNIQIRPLHTAPGGGGVGSYIPGHLIDDFGDDNLADRENAVEGWTLTEGALFNRAWYRPGWDVDIDGGDATLDDGALVTDTAGEQTLTHASDQTAGVWEWEVMPVEGSSDRLRLMPIASDSGQDGYALDIGSNENFVFRRVEGGDDVEDLISNDGPAVGQRETFRLVRDPTAEEEFTLTRLSDGESWSASGSWTPDQPLRTRIWSAGGGAHHIYSIRVGSQAAGGQTPDEFEARLDEFEESINSQFDSFESSVNAQLAEYEDWDTKIDSFQSSVDSRLAAHEDYLDSYDGDGLGGSIYRREDWGDGRYENREGTVTGPYTGEWWNDETDEGIYRPEWGMLGSFAGEMSDGTMHLDSGGPLLETSMRYGVWHFDITPRGTTIDNDLQIRFFLENQDGDRGLYLRLRDGQLRLVDRETDRIIATTDRWNDEPNRRRIIEIVRKPDEGFTFYINGEEVLSVGESTIDSFDPQYLSLHNLTNDTLDIHHVELGEFDVGEREEAPARDFAFAADDARDMSFYAHHQPQAVYREDFDATFVAYFGPDEDPAMLKYDHETQTWDKETHIGNTDLSTENHHMSPSFTMDDEGTIHLVYGMHNWEMQYARSTSPGDIHNWEAPGDIDNSEWTYPELTVIDGRIWILGRHHNSAWNRSIYATYSDDGGDTWAEPFAVVRRDNGDPTEFSDQEDRAGVYFNTFVSGTDIHISWGIRPGSGAQRWNVYYATFDTDTEEMVMPDGSTTGTVLRDDHDNCLVHDSGDNFANGWAPYYDGETDTHHVAWIGSLGDDPDSSYRNYYHSMMDGRSGEWTDPEPIQTSGRGSGGPSIMDNGEGEYGFSVCAIDRSHEPQTVYRQTLTGDGWEAERMFSGIVGPIDEGYNIPVVPKDHRDELQVLLGGVKPDGRERARVVGWGDQGVVLQNGPPTKDRHLHAHTGHLDNASVSNLVVDRLVKRNRGVSVRLSEAQNIGDTGSETVAFDYVNPAEESEAYTGRSTWDDGEFSESMDATWNDDENEFVPPHGDRWDVSARVELSGLSEGDRVRLTLTRRDIGVAREHAFADADGVAIASLSEVVQADGEEPLAVEVEHDGSGSAEVDADLSRITVQQS